MGEVSYQAILGPGPGTPPGHGFVPLPDDAVATRRKDATKEVRVAVSPAQAKWLRRVEDVTGDGIDRDAVVRALLDVGMCLDVDWALLSGAGALRAAVRDAVGVRRRDGD